MSLTSKFPDAFALLLRPPFDEVDPVWGEGYSVVRTGNRYDDRALEEFKKSEQTGVALTPSGLSKLYIPKYRLDEHGQACLTDEYMNAPYEMIIVLKPGPNPPPDSHPFHGKIHWVNSACQSPPPPEQVRKCSPPNSGSNWEC